MALAHSLRLKVVAEGVETAAQRDQLVSLDCDYLQGYLYSKPVPAELLETQMLKPPPQRPRNRKTVQ
jgi:EAL domain-containing protein (putative c-di-GMP-specific phosphodiesterase class I)